MRRRCTPLRLALAAIVAAVGLGAGAAPALALTVTATPPTAVEGGSFAATVATFTDGVSLLGCANPSQFSATITWGDGTSTPGTVGGGIGTLLGPCLYMVGGSHAYVEEGPVNYSVAVTAPGGTVSSGPAGLGVRDAPLTAAGLAFTATQNNAASGTIATFTDANSGAQIADLSATIAWGDGTSGPGTVTGAPGGFAVAGDHTYARTGTFTISTTIKDAGGSQAAVTATATVASAAGVPPPSGSPAPGPTPAVTPRVGLAAPVLARGGTVVVTVRCPVAVKLCRGRLDVATVATPHSTIGPLRTAQTLGATVFIIPGGRRAQLSVRPKRAVVGLLRRAGSIEVAVRALTFDALTGHSQTTSLTAKLKLVPAGH